ncbi:MAG: FAD-dependent oxidoreductase [Rhodospirillaceae bacterium]|nr:FAD-dependent oxidoreductase [Rhodospirillaceae bacterium]MBT5781515.1 FAD-dependent oxidoreductase [Rhodospirillaceae bacterium]
MARDPKYDVLFEPIQIGPKTMRNRFYQTPHCNGAGSILPGTQAAFRGLKAEGGWAVVCTEQCAIDDENELTPNTLATLTDEGDMINLRHMCDEVHKWDSLAGVEFNHMGIAANNLATRSASPSPSTSSSDWMMGATSHAMDEDDILRYQNAYVEASKRAVQTGFDVIYLMGAAGFLPEQFLSKFYNKRTDKYGGSFENRARFWIETLAKMKAAVGDDAAIATRMSTTHYLGADGIQPEEDALKFVELATAEGLVDVWDVITSIFYEWGEHAGPSRFQKSNHEAPFTKFVKGIANVPVVNIGRFTSPDDMAEIIRSGQCDIIGTARPSIADPFLPRKIEEGRTEDIRECIGCNVCISRWERGAPLICTQNAVANEEYRRGWHPEKFEPAPDPYGVLVVGAGPAGMECARVLGERGYDVHLCEAEKDMGGHMLDVMRYPGLSEYGRVISYRQTQLDKLKNVEVHTGTGEMSAEDVLKYGAEKIVVSTGSHWNSDGDSYLTMAPLPGVIAGDARFLTPEQVMAGKEVGERVVVLDADGYFTGIGMAELLVNQGKQVSIVTQHGDVAPMTHYTLEFANLQRMMHEKGITQHTYHWVEEVDVGNVLKVKIFNVFRDGYERATESKHNELPRRRGTEFTELECDTVVLATGRSPNDKLYHDLSARKSEWANQGIEGIYQAGDCYAPRFTADVVFDGHRIARELDSAHPQRQVPYIRERMIWGMDPQPKFE